MKKITLTVTGMTCASCARSVERNVGKIEGVNYSNVNLATEKLSVEFDENKTSINEIKETIQKAGYGVADEKDKNFREVILSLKGMTCASCAMAVERVIGKLDGVDEVSVNLATEKAKVLYDTSKTGISDIKNAVLKAGFEALDIETTKQAQKEDDRKINERKLLWKKFLISAIFTVPLFYIAMGHMIGLPLPQIITPEVNPLNFAILQLILVIPPMIAGYKFYTIGYSRLLRREPNMDSLIAIGTSAAFIYGIYAIIQIISGNHEYAMELYFESVGVIITLILLGKYLEAVSKGKTSEAIKKLMGLAPKTATVIKDGEEQVIPIDEVQAGDIVLVRPGEKYRWTV